MADHRSPRGPGVVYSALAVAVALLVGVLALTATQPPPPTVAEFAPQAVEQIKDAPSEQSSEFGSGEGVGAGSAGEEAAAARPTTAPRTAVDVPRVRRCVGNPPRQTEDPQSPPCVPFWSGDNGGATHTGVTENEVRIYIPTDNSPQPFWQGLQAHFNKRFEFYGRQLTFVPGRNDIGSGNPEVQKADAANAKAANVFASNFYRASQGLYYMEELTRYGIIHATGSLYPFESSYLADGRPFRWQYYMEADAMFALQGDWACRRLVGGRARHGGADVADRERVIGITMQTYYDHDKTDTDAFERELARCGHPIPKERKVRNGVRNDSGGDSTQPLAVDPVTSTNVILQMKGEGVTTILCPCNLFTVGALMSAATNQNYYPEWLLNTYGPNDINAAPILGAWPPEQTRHAFGISVQPRQIRRENEPYWWAVKEGNPSYNDDGSAGTVGNRVELYRPMLLLASGIQMAGPNLTPETFEAGLHRAAFPNPSHLNQPGKVGFGGRSYAMTLDAAEFWYLPGGDSPYTGEDPATLCYVDGGKRRTIRRWPSGDDVFFSGACDSGA